MSAGFNVGVRTRWYSPGELSALLQGLQEGDQLEFDRGIYKHWAVYIGYRQGRIQGVANRSGAP